MNNLPQKIAFVDIETTGLRPTWDRILEIAVLRVEDNQLTKTFHSLINPGGNTYLSPDILNLTGITEYEIENAPKFREIKQELIEILQDCVFVAHNVRFDYSFVKNEFKRLGIEFAPKHFCTVKLSKALFPTQSHHSLDEIISRFNIDCPLRHRAFDDAQVLWEFYKKMQDLFTPEQVLQAISKALKKPTLPVGVASELIDNLPECSGVYIFYGDNSQPLYIGKSVNIRDRVLSHFSADHSSSTEMKICQQIKHIEVMKTTGEFSALVTESHLIKKLQPLYNRRLRRAQKMIVLKKLQQPASFDTVSIEELETLDPSNLDQTISIFRSRRQAQNFLIKQAKDFNLCEKLLGLEKTKSACFASRLGKCKGACCGKESVASYNLRFVQAFSDIKFRKWPFATPIMIEEKSQLEDAKKELHLIDQWCYLGSIYSDSDLENSNLNQEFAFDLDTYKILDSYLKNPKNQKKIKLFNKQVSHPKQKYAPFTFPDQSNF